MALYGYKRSDVTNRNGAPLKAPREGALIHRGRSSSRYSGYYGWLYSQTAHCGSTELTSGRWSFRAPKDWDPLKVNLVDAAFDIFTGGKGVPAWAYERELCGRCFPKALVWETCNMGHKHVVKRKGVVYDDGPALVGGNQ